MRLQVHNLLHPSNRQDGDYLEHTGLIPAISITGQNNRSETKGHLEVIFELASAGVEAKPKPVPKVTAAPAQKVVCQKPLSKDVNSQAADLVDYFLEQLSKADPNTEEGRKKIRETSLNEATFVLTALQNTSFARGYQAK